MIGNKFVSVKSKTAKTLQAPTHPQTYQFDPYGDPQKMTSEELTAAIKFFMDLKERQGGRGPHINTTKTLKVNRFIRKGH